MVPAARSLKIYTESKLSTLIYTEPKLNQGTCGTLSEDEVKIMSGVLDMANKVAKDAMHRHDA